MLRARAAGSAAGQGAGLFQFHPQGAGQFVAGYLELLLAEQVDMVVVPGAEGDFGVLPRHAPLISTLRPGIIRVFEGREVKNRIVVAGGFVEVTPERCTVLAEEAVPVADIDAAQIEQELKDLAEDLADAKSDEEKAAIETVLPGVRFVAIAADCHALRSRKTPEEIAMTQRVYRYFDRLHAFARDYVLARGTDATDFEIGLAMRAFGINLLLQDVQRDGRPHTAIGIDVTAHYVRSRPATAYPHPNQFFCNRIERGQPLYINSDMYLGGYGGECYRNYQIAPVAPHQERMWQVVADCAEIMVEGCKPGRACSSALSVTMWPVVA